MKVLPYINEGERYYISIWENEEEPEKLNISLDVVFAGDVQKDAMTLFEIGKELEDFVDFLCLEYILGVILDAYYRLHEEWASEVKIHEDFTC